MVLKPNFTDDTITEFVFMCQFLIGMVLKHSVVLEKREALR